MSRMTSLAGRRIAIVTHYWPPIGGAASNRMTGWARALVEAGAEVHVVTPTPSPDDPYWDPAYTRDSTADVLVHETPRRDLAAGRRESATPADVRPSPTRRLKLLVRDLLELPDHRRIWNLEADRCLRRIGPLDAVLTTSPYRSTHLVGLRWKKRTGGVWLADFRDPWPQHDARRTTTPFHRRYLASLERRVVASADRLTFFHDWAVDDLTRRLGETWRAKSRVIWNGVREESMAKLEASPFEGTHRPFRIVYAGTAWDWSVPPGFAAGWRAFREALGGDAELHVFGRIEPDAARALGVGEHGVVAHGMVGADGATAALAEAQALLVLSGPNPESVSSKLFECIAARRPVLYFGLPSSPGARELTAVGAPNGVVKAWTASETEALWARFAAAVTAAAWDGWEPREVPPTYAREAQARRLAEILATALVESETQKARRP